MRIITYASTDAPGGLEAVARIRVPMVGKKGKLVESWHPVIFTGPSEEHVREQAEAWWAEELAKEERRQAGYAKAAEARKAKAS